MVCCCKQLVVEDDVSAAHYARAVAHCHFRTFETKISPTVQTPQKCGRTPSLQVCTCILVNH